MMRHDGTDKQYDDRILYIVENKDMFVDDKAYLFDYIKEFIDSISKDEEEGEKKANYRKREELPSYSTKENEDRTQRIVNQIFESLKVSDERIIKGIIQSSLNAEFSKEIGNRHKEEEKSEISLIIKNDMIKIEIEKDEVSIIDNIRSMNKEIVYIDDPYIIDDLNYGPNMVLQRSLMFSRSAQEKGHRASLSEKLLKDSQDLLENIKTDDKLRDIYNRLENIKLGDLVYKDRAFRYETDEITLDVRNIATGLKTFVIIKKLLENASLESNGVMILDEPEIHLHPKWQLLLAELIVLIQKEFNMHILLNTHSPYFLRAIEIYSKQYGISERCKYYLMELADKNNACAKDVTENTEKIYKLLAEPFTILELV